MVVSHQTNLVLFYLKTNLNKKEKKTNLGNKAHSHNTKSYKNQLGAFHPLVTPGKQILPNTVLTFNFAYNCL